MRKGNPEKNCFLQYDKLYIGGFSWDIPLTHYDLSDSKIYVYNEVLGQVVEHSESVRWVK